MHSNWQVDYLNLLYRINTCTEKDFYLDSLHISLMTMQIPGV